MISGLPKPKEKHFSADTAVPWISNADLSLVLLPLRGIASFHRDEGESSSYFSYWVEEMGSEGHTLSL